MSFTTYYKCLVTITFVIIGLLFGIKDAYALSGVYIYANNGSYYTAYGPAANWGTINSQGYCGKYGSCSPAYMSYTWSGCGSPVNYALWDNINSAQNGVWNSFVPSTHAGTTAAPYTLTYNGGSSHSFSINQAAYSDQWVGNLNYFDINNTWLDDNTCPYPIATIGFDEIEIIY